MVEVQGKASASFGILGSNSINADVDVETLPKEPQPFSTLITPKTNKDVMLQCPECGSTRFFHNGSARSDFDVRIQRYICRSCGRRFSDPDDLKRAKQV